MRFSLTPVQLVTRHRLDQLIRERDAAVRAESELITEVENVRGELEHAQRMYRELVDEPNRIRARRHHEPARIVSAVPPGARLLDTEPT